VTTNYYQLFYTYTRETCRSEYGCEDLANSIEFWQITDNTEHQRAVYIASWLCSFFAMCLLFLSLSDKTCIFAPLAFLCLVVGIGSFYALPAALTKDNSGVCNNPGPCQSLYGTHTFPLNIGSIYWGTSYGFGFACITLIFVFVVSVLSWCCGCFCSKKKKKSKSSLLPFSVSDAKGPKVYTVQQYQQEENFPLMSYPENPRSNPNFDYVQGSASRFEPNVVIVN